MATRTKTREFALRTTSLVDSPSQCRIPGRSLARTSAGLTRAALLAIVPMLMFVLVFFANQLPAGELLPPETSIADAIDHYIDAGLQAAQVTAAPQADDATLLRRLTLDLAGRIPTRDELRAYLESTETDKRVRLTRQLLQSRWHVHHLANTLNNLLRGSGNDGPDLKDYLLVAVAERRPWDRMFRELLGAEASAHAPQRFVQGRVLDQDLLTRDVSSIFLGINISCAQCHVHPYVETLTQDHFFGMKAFFTRSYLFEDRLLERQFAEPLIKYTTSDGEAREVGPTFLTGQASSEPTATEVSLSGEQLAQAIANEQKRIDELKKQNEEKRKADPKSALEYPADATLSLRQRFVEMALEKDNAPLLARSLVNRLWHHFFGQGLVMRVDQMHSANPASHPELLEWLARDLHEHDYDFHRLIEGLVSSQAYSRASEASVAPQPSRSLFAARLLRPLTPLQYGVSLLMLDDPEAFRNGLTDAELDVRIQALEQQAVQRFGPYVEPPVDDLQIGATEALGVSNDPELLQAVGAKLAAQVEAQSDRRQQLDAVVETLLSRPLQLEEAISITDYVATESAGRASGAADGHVPTRRYSAWQQVIWALGTSAPFRFNH